MSGCLIANDVANRGDGFRGAQLEGTYLYKPGNTTGVLVTGKPVQTRLPAPFNQVPGIDGVGYQIHHKFVVCGFNGNDPVVFCGSSNVAQGGEEANGDNLLMISEHGRRVQPRAWGEVFRGPEAGSTDGVQGRAPWGFLVPKSEEDKLWCHTARYWE